MSDRAEIKKHYELADSLIQQSTRDQLAESTLLLCLLIAQYQLAHGEIPPHQAISLLKDGALNEEQLKLLEAAMENAIGVLRYVSSNMPKTWNFGIREFNRC